MSIDQLIAELRPHNDDYLVEELRLARAKISCVDQKVDLFINNPDGKPISTRQTSNVPTGDVEKLILNGERMIAICKLLIERGINPPVLE
jgi:hypothetical protein